VEAPYIQSREDILSGMTNCDVVNKNIMKMLDVFCM